MDGGAMMILGKLALTFGCLIGIPARELWCLRRDRRAAAAQPASQTGSPCPVRADAPGTEVS